MRARGAVSAGLVCGVVLASGAPPAHAQPEPGYQAPFPCGQSWTGTTRPTHSPSSNAVDWNRPGDLGDRVVASAPGVVSRVADLGGSSYGRYVVVDHGDGDTTWHAHLKKMFVVVGQRVDQGQLLGKVGATGNVTGAHLHYEQREGGTVVAPWLDDSPFVLGSTVRSRSCPDVPLAGDWDGDGIDELGVFRRRGTGRFLADDRAAVRLGSSSDDPLAGDWDGDGTSDVGVRRPLQRTFVLRTGSGEASIRLGGRRVRGIAGDWNGNGRTDVGLFQPAEGRFTLRRDDGSTQTVRLGEAGSVPVTGDWDGDGSTDVGVYEAGVFTLLTRTGTPWEGIVPLGSPADLPVTGDWDGDGDTDLGVWDPATAEWTLRVAPRLSEAPGTLTIRTFGRAR